jgi:hypothetical protein
MVRGSKSKEDIRAKANKFSKYVWSQYVEQKAMTLANYLAIDLDDLYEG